MPSSNSFVLHNGKKRQILMENPETGNLIIGIPRKMPSKTDVVKKEISEDEYIDLRKFNELETLVLEEIAKENMEYAKKQAEWIPGQSGDFKEIADIENISLKKENAEEIAEETIQDIKQRDSNEYREVKQ